MQKQKTLSKTCPELPWNHHGETELFLASSAVMNCCLCADLLCHLQSTYTAKCWTRYPLADPLFFPVFPPGQRQLFRSVSRQVVVRLTQLQTDQDFACTTLSGARANPPVTQVSVQSELCSEQSRQQRCQLPMAPSDQLAVMPHWNGQRAGEVGTVPHQQMGRGLRQPRDRVCVSSEGT